MARKIPVLVDEEVYYILQGLRSTPSDDIGNVIRQLLCTASTATPANNDQFAHSVKQHVLIAEALCDIAMPPPLEGTHS